MIPIFESFLKNMSSDTITNAFFWILAFVALAGLLFFFLSRNKHEKHYSEFAEYAPVLLTSLGILGTFTGIVSGLLNFDIENIDASISTLLGGMKTAFLTSVIGVCFSIVLKIIYTSFPKNNSEKAEDNPIDIQAIVNNFYAQTEQLKKQNSHSESLVSHIENLVKSLGNDSDSSILGQIKLLRSDLSDNHRHLTRAIEPISVNLTTISELVKNNQTVFENFENKLWIKLQDFADVMSKSATTVVIDALKQVIQDFNNNLTEQFGENFKELNKAVTALVNWQENYKNQLDYMISLYNASVQSLSITETSIAKIEHSAQSIPATMENLSQVISANQQQINNLENHLNAFAQLRDIAVEAIPEIQKQISTMLQNTEKANIELMSFVDEWQRKFEQSTQQIQHQFNQSVESLMQSHIDDSRRLMARLEKESETALSRTGESIDKQIKALDNALEIELSRVISDMGRALASISNRFTTDYSELVEAMHKITMKGRGF